MHVLCMEMSKHFKLRRTEPSVCAEVNVFQQKLREFFFSSVNLTNFAKLLETKKLSYFQYQEIEKKNKGMPQ